MADQSIRGSDLLPVYSQISWGALLAGLFVTITLSVVLSSLGAAIGLTAGDRVSRETLTVATGVWALATALIAFFCGGCVVARCTTGESKAEAAVYGVVLWGVAFVCLPWLSGNVLRTGLTTLTGGVNAAAAATGPLPRWEAAARRAGVSPEQVTQIRAELPSTERVQRESAQAAWWAFGGVSASLAAVIAGAITGAPRWAGSCFAGWRCN